MGARDILNCPSHLTYRHFLLTLWKGLNRNGADYYHHYSGYCSMTNCRNYQITSKLWTAIARFTICNAFQIINPTTYRVEIISGVSFIQKGGGGGSFRYEINIQTFSIYILSTTLTLQLLVHFSGNSLY